MFIGLFHCAFELDNGFQFLYENYSKLISHTIIVRATCKKPATFSSFDFTGETFFTDKDLSDSHWSLLMKHSRKMKTGSEFFLNKIRNLILNN